MHIHSCTDNAQVCTLSRKAQLTEFHHVMHKLCCCLRNAHLISISVDFSICLPLFKKTLLCRLLFYIKCLLFINKFPYIIHKGFFYPLLQIGQGNAHMLIRLLHYEENELEKQQKVKIVSFQSNCPLFALFTLLIHSIT